MQNLYNEVLKFTQSPKNIEGFAISLTISTGICKYPTDGVSCDDLYHNARLTLAKAKKCESCEVLLRWKDSLFDNEMLVFTSLWYF